MLSYSAVHEAEQLRKEEGCNGKKESVYKRKRGSVAVDIGRNRAAGSDAKGNKVNDGKAAFGREADRKS